MLRVPVMLLVVVGVVLADEGCTGVGDCECGSVCNNGNCEEGCMVFDTFLAPGAESDVNGRQCKCGDTADDKGRPILCDEGGEFTGAPEGIDMYTANPKCPGNA